MPRTTRTTPQGRRALAGACALALALVAAPGAQARLGDLDPSFGATGGAAFPAVGATSSARFEALVERPDGRLVAGGWAVGAGEEAVVAQIAPSGAPDPGFGAAGVTRIPAGPFYRRIHGLALDGSGNVLAAGDRRPTTAPAAQPAPEVLRLTAAGALEGAFTIAAAAGEARAVEVLPDGKLLVAGWRIPVTGGVQRFFVARLNTDGSPDQTFGLAGVAEAPFAGDSRALGMAVEPSGRIVLAGWAFLSGRTVPALARFTATGVIDQGFGPGGTLAPLGNDPDGSPAGQLRAVGVDATGRITAAGVSGRFAAVVRRRTDGTPDPGFGVAGATYAAVGETAELQGMAIEGGRALVAGAAGPGRGPAQILLSALDGAGSPDAGLGGAPLGWRRFEFLSGVPVSAFAVAAGPAGTVYTAGGFSQNLPYVSRHLPNAAPAAALAAPAGEVVGAPVTLDAGGSADPEGETLRYAFDLDGDGSYEFGGGENPLAFLTFEAPGAHTVGVRVSDPRGATATAQRAITVTVARNAPPRPLLGKRGVAKPLRGVVRYRLRGKRRFKRLTGLTAIPNGTEIDARKGRVLITVLHDASGRLDGARFYAGRFIFKQGKGRRPLTTLRLSGGSFASCPSGPGARAGAVPAVAASVTGGKGAKKRVRRLWGDGRGRFRTRGRYGAATVRGTRWLTLDRCDGTKVRVARGEVSVADLVRSDRRPRRLTRGESVVIKRGGS